MSIKRFDVYAPVLIPTLCRYEHFRRCIESLRRCTGAEYTDLYIGLDYPTKESHWPGYNKICEYVSQITGFNQVVVFKRESNLGARANVKALKASVINLYDRCIVSEDDNEFSPNFLEYMNAGLTRYKDNPDVLRICGNLMPWDVDYKAVMGGWGKNAFPAMDYNAMGVGSWFDKPLVLPYTKDSVLKSWKLTYKAFKEGYCTAIHRMLHQLYKDTQLPDVCFRLYCAFHHKYCIFPAVSKVKNWGYDGTGLHSDNNSHWIDVQVLDTSCDFDMDDFEIVDYPEVKSFVRQMFDANKKIKLWIMINYVFYRLTGRRFKDVFGKILAYLKKKSNWHNDKSLILI